MKRRPTSRQTPREVRRSVSIIGPGNWGSSLAHALEASGVALHEVMVAKRRSSVASKTRVRALGGSRALPLVSLERAQLEADVLWLCVPDAAIAGVARRLVERVSQQRAGKAPLQGQVVVHSSGALSAQEMLKAAARAGASVASVHPLMSFPTPAPVSLQGVWFGIEGDAAARRILGAMVRRMGGHPFVIQPGSKALYHAMGTLASPLLVSHLAAAQEAAVLAGFSRQQARRLVEPIARATLDNFFRKGAGKSFSGPLARGDGQTIRLHLQALQAHPILAGVYRWLALYALEALPVSGEQEIRRLLRESPGRRA